MTALHEGLPAWKDELRQAGRRVLTDVDDACLTLAHLAARGFDQLGLHRIGKFFELPPAPPPPKPEA
jgi:hypothetical protein